MKLLNCILFFLLLSTAGCSSSSTAVRPSYYQSGKSENKSHRTVAEKEEKDEDIVAERKTPAPQENQTEIKESPKSHSDIEKKATKYIGSRYKYGGTTAKGFDCSGYVWRVYQDIGLEFSRASSQEYFKRGEKINRKSARKGDLVFFRDKGRINHVGIYLGGNRFIHSSSSRGVIESSLENSYWKPRVAGFRRFI